MSRKKRKPSNVARSTHAPAKPGSTPAARGRYRRKWLMRILSFTVFLGVSAAGVAAYKKSWEAEHDLSAIGNGVSTVVQIHDPRCSLCRQLQSNTRDALRGFGERIQYRVANINTPEGKAFQIRHRQPHVTLVLFDGRGRQRGTLTGVRDSAELRAEFEGLLN